MVLWKEATTGGDKGIRFVEGVEGKGEGGEVTIEVAL